VTTSPSKAIDATRRKLCLIGWLANVLLIGLLMFSRATLAGEFAVREHCNSDSPICVANIEYHGTITITDVEQFRAALKIAQRRSDFNHQVILTSVGGDVDAALQIGKLIRSAHLSTGSVNECYSSCVIVLAGGVERYPIIDMAGVSLGKVGIHRPFTTMSTGTYDEHRDKFNRMEQEIKRYFREGGVSERLWDDMVKTAPENIRYLSSEELSGYGLRGADPAYADFLDSKEAIRFGIPKIEYMKRKAGVKVLCDSSPEVLADSTGKSLARCRADVYRGRLPR